MFEEYLGVHPAWAIINVNRSKRQRFMTIDKLMSVASPARPEQPMREAQPGERPPSRRKPGEKDRVIENFDRYMRATQRR